MEAPLDRTRASSPGRAAPGRDHAHGRIEIFVLRVWTPAGRELRPTPDAMRGFIHHVGSGTEKAFCDSAELLASIRGQLSADGGRTAT